jgi:alpha-amylase
VGGDEIEQVLATPFAQHDRIRPSGAARSIRAYSHFKFPGRAAHHSSFEWRWRHFDAVDYDHDRPDDRGTIYLLDGKRFDDQVALDNGNYAYLMGCDLDFQNPEVQEEISRWGRWYLDLTGVDGFRLDAIKHISAWLFPSWLDEMERHAGRDLFVVGEYWNGDVRTLRGYLEAVGWRMSVFDVPLHYRLYEASLMGTQFDMRRIFDGTVVEQCPTHAVTFVDNHDSQPLQALESVVAPWFKPLAYALVLLRRDGYPCVFLADYDGAEYEDRGRDGNLHSVSMASHRYLIDVFLEARRACNHGPQYDYFDDPRWVGWTRLGTAEAPAPMAVLMSTGDEASKWMEVGRRDAIFRDVTGHVPEEVHTNADGWGEFRCRAGSVSVWRTG